MFSLVFILQFTKSNGYDGTRGLTGVGVIGDTNQGCQCQCFDPTLGIKNQTSSGFVYIRSTLDLLKKNKNMAAFCPPGHTYTRMAALPNYQYYWKKILFKFAVVLNWTHIWPIVVSYFFKEIDPGVLDRFGNTAWKGMFVEKDQKNGAGKVHSSTYNMALIVKILICQVRN